MEWRLLVIIFLKQEHLLLTSLYRVKYCSTIVLSTNFLYFRGRLMDNEILGRTMKAMYKLSGKTINQLADETNLSIDTINNLFYARLLKPSFDGICTLVDAMGFTVSELMSFMEQVPEFPNDADYVERLVNYKTSRDPIILDDMSSFRDCVKYIIVLK